MAHHTTKSGYVQLVDRLNRFPQGAPPSKLLYKIIEMLFSEKEAKLLSLLPLRPFSAEKAAHVWKMDRIRTCYCRHKMSHMGRDCDAPKEICMTFNSVASSLIKYDYARRVEVSECLELLETAYSYNLVLESHRAMAAVLGVILKLGPVKQAMASQQMKSICLETLVSRLNL